MRSLPYLLWQHSSAATLKRLVLCFIVLSPLVCCYAAEIASPLVSPDQGSLILFEQVRDIGDRRLPSATAKLDDDDDDFDDFDEVGIGNGNGNGQQGQDRLVAAFGGSEEEEEKEEEEKEIVTTACPKRKLTARDVTALGNNQFIQRSIKIGETQLWYFPKRDVLGRKTEFNTTTLADWPREYFGNVSSPASPVLHASSACPIVPSSGSGDANTTVYLSLTACSKPSVHGGHSGNEGLPFLPQLETYISTSNSQRNPGPGKDESSQRRVQAEEGYLCARVQSDGDIFIAVTAPNTSAYSGHYEYQLAVSVDALFHRVNDSGSYLAFVDSDTNAALIVTGDLLGHSPELLIKSPPPFVMMSTASHDFDAIAGLERSYCALERYSQSGKGNVSVHSDMTTRGGVYRTPKAQYNMTGLNRSASYRGHLAVNGNSTTSGNGVIGGGGKVFRPINFKTRSGKFSVKDP